MKFITLSFFLFFTSPQADKTVYTCNSDKAPRYHYKSNCRGLSNCNYKTVKTTLAKAKKEGKTLCKWED